VAARRLTPMAAALLVAGSLLAPGAADAAEPARFKVVAVKGEQTSTWSQTIQATATCQAAQETGEQTISLESTAQSMLKIKRSVGGGAGGSSGATVVQTSWAVSRAISRSGTSTSCSTEASCDLEGPFAVPVTVSYKKGEVGLRGELACDQGGPPGLGVLDGHASISKKNLLGGRRRSFDVHISKRVEQALPGGSLTTVLDAVVTLRRTRP
jgi:hypothetical protein